MWEVQAGLHSLQVSQLTKLSLQLILFQKLAAHNAQYHSHFEHALREYEAYLLTRSSPLDRTANQPSSSLTQIPSSRSAS